MKWVCVAVLVLDLLLVAGAAFRVMTVPKKDVAAVEDKLIGALDKLEEAAGSAVPAEGEEGDFTHDWEKESGEAAEPGTEAGEIDYKNIELNEETLENYDDQAEKGERLDRATEKIQERFGSK